MLGGLFKPNWQSSSVEKRLAAIEKMDSLDPESQSAFETLANNDVDASVRLATIKKLNSPLVAFNISQSHADKATQAQAKVTLNTLIGSKSQLSISDFKALITDEAKLSLDIAKHCPHAELRTELIQALPELEQAKLIADISYTETRLLVANSLSSIDALETARKALSGKDKNAEKVIRSKLETIRNQEKQAQDNRDAAEQVAEKMGLIASQISKGNWLPEFKGQYSINKQRWDDFYFTPESKTKQRYEQALSAVSTEIEAKIAIENAETSQKELARKLESQCHRFAKLESKQLLNSKDAIETELTSITTQWLETSKTILPTLAVEARYKTAKSATESVIAFCNNLGDQPLEAPTEENKASAVELKQNTQQFKTALSHLHWPTSYPELNAKTEVSADFSNLKVQLSDTLGAEKNQLDKLHKRINRLLGSTSRGELGRANRELAAVTKAATKYTGKDKTALDERLEKTAEAVKKMGDWKDFATEPKFIELCDAMEKLAASKAHPDKLAKDISTLQQRWKALGFSESSDQHWERFKSAGDKAYEPCAAFFKERHDTQIQNLQQREPILQKMRDLLEKTDWQDQPDYKQVEVSMRDISNEWQTIKNVDQFKGKKQWDQLTKVKSAIFEKLNVVYIANIELKYKLIEQAEGLLELDVNDGTLGKMQLFQTRWKQVGVTRRKDDQAAWEKFKTTTDAIYDKIQGLRKEKRADEDAQLKGYRDISKQIQALAKGATELATSDPAFEQLQADYTELPALPIDLPEKLVEGLDKDFKRAESAYSQARERIIKTAEGNEFKKLEDKAALCTKLEALIQAGKAEQVDKVTTEIAAITITNKELTKRIDARIAQASDTDRDDFTKARQLICIDLEILLGKDSPAEDKALRMQIQLDKMKLQGIGHNQVQKEKLLNQFKIDWLCLAGAEAKAQTKLEARFNKLF